MRRFASILLAVIAWPAMLIGAAYAFVGLYASMVPGGFVVHAGSAGPGLVMVVTGAVIGGVGWALRWCARRIRPPSYDTKGVVRG